MTSAASGDDAGRLKPANGSKLQRSLSDDDSDDKEQQRPPRGSARSQGGKPRDRKTVQKPAANAGRLARSMSDDGSEEEGTGRRGGARRREERQLSQANQRQPPREACRAYCDVNRDDQPDIVSATTIRNPPSRPATEPHHNAAAAAAAANRAASQHRRLLAKLSNKLSNDTSDGESMWVKQQQQQEEEEVQQLQEEEEEEEEEERQQQQQQQQQQLTGRKLAPEVGLWRRKQEGVQLWMSSEGRGSGQEGRMKGGLPTSEEKERGQRRQSRTLSEYDYAYFGINHEIDGQCHKGDAVGLKMALAQSRSREGNVQPRAVPAVLSKKTAVYGNLRRSLSDDDSDEEA